MNRIILLLSLGIIHLAGLSQGNSKSIIISNDLELIRLSENAYLHVSYTNLPGFGRSSANGLIFIDRSNAFLFDTPWTDSLTMLLVTYLQDNMGLKIIGFIPNHWHNDCIGGIGYLKGGMITFYANQLTIDIAGAKNLPMPAHGFTDSLRIHIGDKVIDCYFLGAAHSLDNIVVWIPSEKILFPGCMVKSLNTTNTGNIADGDLSSYPGTISKLIGKFNTAKIVIPGHGQIGGVDLLEHTRDLLTY